MTTVATGQVLLAGTSPAGLAASFAALHAVSCAKPNLKLRKVLERRGFVVEEIKGIGAAYHLTDIGT